MCAEAQKEELLKKLGRKILREPTTDSGFEVNYAYGPQDIANLDYHRDIGDPGKPPYTRGAYPKMYREMLWARGGMPAITATNVPLEELAAETKRRLETGQLSSGVRFVGGYNTQCGIDPDHPIGKYDFVSCGEPGYGIGVKGSSLEESIWPLLVKSVNEGFVMELGNASGPADVCLYTMYVAMLEERGLDISKLRGNAVNDPLHQHIMQSQGCCQPLDLTLKLTVDSIAFAIKNTPKFRACNGGCAYDMREGGLNTIQELAFRFGNWITYTDLALERAITFEEIGNKCVLAFSGEIDFFETICMLRAARRMWASIAKERYGADLTRMKCPPCNTNLAGSSMTKQQPVLNIVRIAYEALASVLGGVNGMEFKHYTEAYSTCPNEAIMISEATGHILSEELGVPLCADPLGGSYYVEWLTDKIYQEAMAYLQKILDMGGMVAAINAGWAQGEFEKAAQDRQRELEEKKRIKVCVNAFEEYNNFRIDLPGSDYKVDAATGFKPEYYTWMEQYKRFKQERDINGTADALKNLYHVMKRGENTMRPMIEAWKARASIGEVMGVLREAAGYTYDPWDMVQRPAFITY